MIYKDYQDAIFKFYETRKNENVLSLNLQQPSPSKIRDECIIIYRSRSGRKDLATLRTFFEVGEGAELSTAMQHFEIDKFRPLVNYLKKATADTEHKNIELLAWLLNFQPRPWNNHDDYKSAVVSSNERKKESLPSGDIIEENENDEDDDATEPPIAPIQLGMTDSNQTTPPQGRIIKKLGFIAGGIVIVSGIIAAVIINNKDDRGCMIWENDHYEQVSCDSSGGAMGLVLGLDASSVRHLRRITRPDTLTEKDIGKVWYRKRGVDSLDFYTTGGRDPVDPNLDLKRLTAYIFDKYLKQNK